MKDAVRADAIAACGMADYEPTPEDMKRIAWAVAAFLRACRSIPKLLAEVEAAPLS